VHDYFNGALIVTNWGELRLPELCRGSHRNAEKEYPQITQITQIEDGDCDALEPTRPSRYPVAEPVVRTES
jgi:hypothetical protein